MALRGRHTSPNTRREKRSATDEYSAIESAPAAAAAAAEAGEDEEGGGRDGNSVTCSREIVLDAKRLVETHGRGGRFDD